MKFKTMYLPSGQTYKLAFDESIDTSLVPSPAVDLVNTIAPKGTTVLDLGAFVGSFSIPVATLGYKVLAFEPNERNVLHLRAAIYKNGLAERVKVLEAAVTDENNDAAFFEDGPHSFVVTSNDEVKEAHFVSAITVEDALRQSEFDDVTFVKMDIEGSEIRALDGMRSLLAVGDIKAFVYEANGYRLLQNGHSPQQLKSVFKEYGYRSYLLLPNRLIPVEVSDIQPSNVADYLAVKSFPQELVAWLQESMSKQEVLSRLQAEWNSPKFSNRMYVATVLQSAPEDVISCSEVNFALDRLAKDSNVKVREAASWFPSLLES